VTRIEDEESFEDSPDRSVHYVDDDVDDEPAPVRERMTFHGSSHRDRLDRPFPWPPVLAAAAAGFVIAIVFGPCQRTNLQQEEQLASLQTELQSTKDRAAQLEAETSGDGESAGTDDASAHAAKADDAAKPDDMGGSEPPAKADASEHRASEQKLEAKAETRHETAPAPRREERRELTPDEVLHRPKPNASPGAAEAAEAAAPAEPAAATAPPPPPDPSPEPPQAEPERVALAEPSSGAASVYEVPDPSAPTVRAYSRSGTPGVAALQVLAPERAGWTTEAQPTIYWHASQGARFPGEFTLTREGEDEPIVRGRFPAPDASGIRRIELSQFDVKLDEGVSYRWSVSFVDPEHEGEDLAIGGIRRVTPPDAVRSITDATPVIQRLDALERAGLWYDALDLVTRSIERNPSDKSLLARRTAMLARVGIQLQGS
jgi:hypothetical protein